MEKPLEIDDVQHAVALRRSLNEMRQNNQNCDTVIKVGKDEMAVHRNVLMAQSDYFNAMFTHDTLENQTGVVEMKDVRFAPVKKCVDFFYTGEISTNEEGCEDLLHTASLMQVKLVCNKIAPFLQNCLNPESFFNIKKIAAQFDLENLNKVCDEFAVDKLDLIVKEDGFNQLEMENVLNLIGSKKSYDSESENSKLAIILQWVKADVENRHDFLLEMIKTLDLVKISPEYSRHLAENEMICYQSAECLKMLFLGQLDQTKIVATPSNITFPTYSKRNAIIVFDLSSKFLQAYKPETNAWTRMHQLHQDMHGTVHYVAVATQSYIYALLANRKVYRINVLKTNSNWARMTDMLTAHELWIRAVADDGFIYVGSDISMERYCESNNAWQEIGVGSTSSTLAAYNRLIFSIGGSKTGPSAEIRAYSPESSTWSSLKQMQVPRQIPGVVVHGGKIYAAGGYSGAVINDVECYDPNSNDWTKLPSMIKARCCFGLLSIGDFIYAVGRYEDQCNIERFDLESRKWEFVEEQTGMKIMARATVAVCLPE